MANQSIPFGRSALDGENVIPRYNKVPAEGVFQGPTVLQFDPARVNTRMATGGFNSVFEIAAATCLRVFKHELRDLSYAIGVKARDLIDFLSAQSQLPSVTLNRILSAVATGNYTFNISYVPVALQFIDDKKLAVKLVAYVELQEPVHRQDLPVENDAPHTGQTVDKVFQPIPHSTVNIIGNWSSYFEMELQCAYSFISNAGLTTVDVYALLNTAAIQYNVVAPDMKLLFDQYFTPHLDALLQMFTRHERVAICPDLSIVGANAMHVHVQEVAIFDVSVFPVKNSGGKVLAIACNLRQGCRGTDEFVRNFIGDADYGIISDEYLVSRVVKFRWRLGGFHRSLELESHFQAKSSDGRDLTGILRGNLSLSTLDNVSIECDSNTRTDYIRLGGNAVSEATHIGLDSGEQLDPQSLKLGPPLDIPWNLFTSLELSQSWSPQNELRLFQLAAHVDAYQFLGRPFRSFPDANTVQVIYARTEGVSKQVYLLGHFPVIF